SNGTISGFSGSGAVYTFTVTATGQGTVTVNVPAAAAADAATNPNTASNTLSWIYDSVAPSVVLSGGATGSTNVAAHSVTATFSESVTGFTAGDVVVSNGTISV